MYDFDSGQIDIEIIPYVAESDTLNWSYQFDTPFPTTGNAGGTVVTDSITTKVSVTASTNMMMHVVLVDLDQRIVGDSGISKCNI